MSVHEIAIGIEKLNFSYEKGKEILSNISLNINRGEFFALLGSNGAGKSTLLKLMNGLLKEYEGTIKIFGEDIRKIKRDQLFTIVCTVFQDPNDQLFALTVYEDISFGPRNMGLLDKEVKERVMSSLEAVGLQGFENRPIKTLSYGQKKRLCIAGVLAMQPKIILMDEPLSGLDPMGVREIAMLLKKLNKEKGLTIVMATHEVDLIPLYVDRVAILSKGKITRLGEPANVFSGSEELKNAKLRLPYVAKLMEQLKSEGALEYNKLPLTVGEAKKEILKKIQS
ncbi:MAG: energy-coupling factor ABC transporter ATP-binding protein [Proteobacteria bacterium]|nr:energy-coupling factor ABC transporter ATP-binding protein [Pseudomonadota bacterium]